MINLSLKWILFGACVSFNHFVIRVHFCLLKCSVFLFVYFLVAMWSRKQPEEGAGWCPRFCKRGQIPAADQRNQGAGGADQGLPAGWISSLSDDLLISCCGLKSEIVKWQRGQKWISFLTRHLHKRRLEWCFLMEMMYFVPLSALLCVLQENEKLYVQLKAQKSRSDANEGAMFSENQRLQSELALTKWVHSGSHPLLHSAHHSHICTSIIICSTSSPDHHWTEEEGSFHFQFSLFSTAKQNKTALL